MSKKRHISLSSKWKLKKEHEDYKQHKIDKRVGGAGYVVEEQPLVKAKKRCSYKCKKTRGEHKWELQDSHKIEVMNEDYNFYKCNACGKEHAEQKYEWVCKDCGAVSEWFWLLWHERDKRKCKKCGSYNFKRIKRPILGI